MRGYPTWNPVMNLLLTGGAGFIGHHLVEHVLKNTDWNIVILDALTYAGDLGKLTLIENINIWDKEMPRVSFVWHDLRSPLENSVAETIGDVDYIWHLAAETHVDRSLVDSIPFVLSNVLGTTNLLDFARKQDRLQRFVQFSTDEVFGPAPAGVLYREGDTCNPSNPYAASKEGAEAMSKAYAFSFGVPVTITRTMNVFGERQHPEKFIPKTIRSVLNDEKVVIHGLPGNISSRCWIHARNVGEALRWVTERGELIQKAKQNDPQHGIYHIVGEEASVLALANRIAQIARGRGLDDGDIDYVDFHSTRPGHDLRYALDGGKLKCSGFEYPYTLDDSFDKCVRWMAQRDNRRWLGLQKTPIESRS